MHSPTAKQLDDLWSHTGEKEHAECVCIYQCRDEVSSMKNQETDSRVSLSSWIRDSIMV